MLTFLSTPRSLRSLNGLHQRVTDNWSALDEQGVNVIKFWPDIQTGQERIGVENLTASDTAVLDRMFGSDAISVFNVTPGEFR
jgi:hypothetical protein